MKATKTDRRISWLAIFMAAILQLLIISILAPVGTGAAWIYLSSFTLLGGMTFLAIYEKIKGEENKAFFLTILNGTLMFWWAPISILIWHLIE